MKRFKEREATRREQFKITAEDWRNRRKWDELRRRRERHDQSNEHVVRPLDRPRGERQAPRPCPRNRHAERAARRRASRMTWSVEEDEAKPTNDAVTPTREARARSFSDAEESLPFDVELERLPTWVHVSWALVILVGVLVATHLVHMLVFLPFLVASSVGKRFASIARHVVVGPDTLFSAGAKSRAARSSSVGRQRRRRARATGGVRRGGRARSPSFREPRASAPLQRGALCERARGRGDGGGRRVDQQPRARGGPQAPPGRHALEPPLRRNRGGVLRHRLLVRALRSPSSRSARGTSCARSSSSRSAGARIRTILGVQVHPYGEMRSVDVDAASSS